MCVCVYIYIYIFFFFAVLSRRCCLDFFSSCGKWGMLSSCGVWACHCSGFSLQSSGSRMHRLQQLWQVDSVVTAPGLQSTSSMWCTGIGAPWHVGSSQTRDQTCASCIGQGGFFTTEPLGKPLNPLLLSIMTLKDKGISRE